MRGSDKAKAARAGNLGRLTASDGEACEPQVYDTTNLARAQDTIDDHLRAAWHHAHFLAAHHLSLAERFQIEAEAMAELIIDREVPT